jgi:hypothetical protein
MNLPSGLVFYLDFKYGSTVSGRTSGDNMYGNVSTANSKIGVDVDPSGGLYGAGQFGYSISSSRTTVQTTTGAANSASIAYQDGLVPSQFKTVAVSTGSLNVDLEGVRAFRIFSASVDVTTHPELTTQSGANLLQNIISKSFPKFRYSSIEFEMSISGTISGQFPYLLNEPEAKYFPDSDQDPCIVRRIRFFQMVS